MTTTCVAPGSITGSTSRGKSSTTGTNCEPPCPTPRTGCSQRRPQQSYLDVALSARRRPGLRQRVGRPARHAPRRAHRRVATSHPHAARSPQPESVERGGRRLVRSTAAMAGVIAQRIAHVGIAVTAECSWRQTTTRPSCQPRQPLAIRLAYAMRRAVNIVGEVFNMAAMSGIRLRPRASAARRPHLVQARRRGPIFCRTRLGR